MFIDDTDRGEWRGLRERLELEGEARQFLAYKAARPVIAVTCASRFELFGMADAAEERRAAVPQSGASRGEGGGAGAGDPIVGLIGSLPVIRSVSFLSP